MRYGKPVCLTSSLLLLMGISLPLFAADPPLPTPVGRVVWVKGTLKAIMPNAEQRILQKTSVIYLKDTLTTDSQSQAQIVFTDNTLMTFRQDTKFSIDQYEFRAQSKTKSVGKYIMNLIEGGFRTITGAIAKQNPNDYQVNTPVATIGVRGTDYAAFVKAGQLSMAFYAGAPCMKSKEGSLCLSSSVPYGAVSFGAAPVALKQTPAVFQEKLEIVPAKISPFTGGGSGTSPAPKTGGVVSSFCITQ